MGTMRRTIFCILAVLGFLLVTGCSTFSTDYTPASDSKFNARSKPANIIKKIEEYLIAAGYICIGHVMVSCQVSDTSADVTDALLSRMIDEATRQGGDLVRIRDWNDLQTDTEYHSFTKIFKSDFGDRSDVDREGSRYGTERVDIYHRSASASVWRQGSNASQKLEGISEKDYNEFRRETNSKNIMIS
jgi:hypothetical protein